MVPISFVLFSTIIVVTMATIFFCCWRKKGSGNLAPCKTNSAKEDFKKERSVSPTPVAVLRPESVQQTENHGPQVLVDPSEADLGDFSAVQRETEILRSYRKPPPPKNRAKQSRAPRTLTSGTASLDIFTELSEEDNKNVNDDFDRENIDSRDDAGDALLRTSSESKEARSSMLADIDQTLAALQTSDQTTLALSGEGSLSDDKIKISEDVIKVVKDTLDEKTASQALSELNTTEVILENKTSSNIPLITLDSQSENISKSNQIGTPKVGPKVSPKPSPRSSKRISSCADNKAARETVEMQASSHVSKLLSLSLSQDTVEITDSTASSLVGPSSRTDASSTAIGSYEGKTFSGLQSIIDSAKETSTETSKTLILSDTGSDVLSIPTDSITFFKDDLKYDDSINGSTPDKAEFIQASEATKVLENHVNETDEDTVIEDNESNATKGNTDTPRGDSSLQDHAADSTPELTVEKTKERAAELVAEITAPYKDTSPVLPVSSQESQEMDTQDDQNGKGKISKIPVRSGSKPRSSPPK